MNINLNVSALDKLVDYTASGIGSVAGLMMAMWVPWKAKQEAEAKKIAAEGDATILQTITSCLKIMWAGLVKIKSFKQQNMLCILYDIFAYGSVVLLN